MERSLSTMAKRSRTAAERAQQADRLRTRPARTRLLAAARDLATARGYESIRAGDIATAAGVSRETFYTHFAGKRSCLAEATEPRLGEIEIKLRIATEEGAAWAAPILATLEATLHDRYGSRTTPRGRIIESMLALVAERGYSSVRLADVIKAAKVSYPSFYRHFESKEQCFAAACESLIAQLADRLETDVDGDANLSARLVALAEFLADDPTAAKTLAVEAERLPCEQSATSPGGPATWLSDLLAGELVASRMKAATSPTPIPPVGLQDASRYESHVLLAGALLELLRDAVMTARLEELPAQVAALIPYLVRDSEKPGGAGDRLLRRTRPTRQLDRRGGSTRRLTSTTPAGASR